MKREFANAAAWTMGASVVEQVAAAVAFLVIARLIGVENFGIVSMAFAFLFLGEFLVRDTLTEAIVERPEIEEGRLEATFAVLMAVSVAIVVALAIIAPIVATVYSQPIVAPLLIASSPTVLMIGAGGVSTALLRRRMAYRALAIRTVIGVASGGAVGIAMALAGFGAWSLVGQRLVEIGLNSLLAVRAAGWRPRRWPRRGELALVRGLGPTVVGLRSVTLVIAQTPTVLLGALADPRTAGLFAFAQRLVEIVLTLSARTLQGAAQSALAEMRRQGGRTVEFFLDLAELTALTAFVAYAGLALIAVPLTDVLLGPEWRGASEVLPLLCVAGAVAALTGIQEAYLLAIDRLAPLVAAAAVEAALGLALVAWAAPHGHVAVGAAVALRALLALPVRAVATLGPDGVTPPRVLRALVSPVMVAAGMAAVVGVWRLLMLGRMPDVLYVALTIAVGIAAAGAVLFGAMPRTVARLREFVTGHP